MSELTRVQSARWEHLLPAAARMLMRSRNMQTRMALLSANLCSGIGIAQEVQTQIFEAFAQADMSTSQHTEAITAAVSCELNECQNSCTGSLFI